VGERKIWKKKGWRGKDVVGKQEEAEVQPSSLRGGGEHKGFFEIKTLFFERNLKKMKRIV
jgi:hypothetical protein